ncbi:MAG: MMPL family transporter [Fibrobacteria bacterium]|nr:MMPL family transporter [Fibrobacteria bacterium]
MYTFICRLFHSLHRWPKTVVGISLILTLISFYYAQNLEIRFSLADVLPEKFQSVQELERVKEKFGGLGKLTLVVSSESATENKAAVNQLVHLLRSHPDINILDYKRETDFFEKNKLLYIRLEDLQEIEKRIEAGFWAARKNHNPLLVDLLDEEEEQELKEDDVFLKDLEEKYASDLRSYLGSEDEKALIMHIFPRFDVSDVEKCRAFFSDIQTAIRQLTNWNKVNILFTGEVMESIQNEGRLLSEIMSSGWLSFFIILTILVLFFFRVPTGSLLIILPLIMGILWTMALTYLFIGYLSMITLSLGIILLGLGLDAALHLLARYSEERRKNLSAKIAFETIILETGPAVTTGALTSAAAFFAITITDFKGFSEFGLIAGMGMLCTLIAILLVFPCILILVEPLKLVTVFGPRIYNHTQFSRKPYRSRKLHFLVLILVTIILCFRGVQYDFEYNFDKLGFPNTNAIADSIVQSTGDAISSPTVVLCPNQSEARRVAQHIKEYKLKDTLSPTIHSVMTLSDLLPERQKEKMNVITKLNHMITPKIINSAGERLKGDLQKLKDALDITPVNISDLPESFRKKFTGKNRLPGNFTFIFPSVDLNDGLNCMAFAEDTRVINPDSTTTYYTSGIAVIYADLLTIMIPDILKALMLAMLTVFILVLFHTRSCRGTLVIIFPIIISIIWTMGFMKHINMKISYFNLVVLPSMIGIGIDNSVHLYHRYLEEGIGSLHFVLKRTGRLICITSATSAAGFFGLAFSSHRGLYAMGITAILGISLTLLASLLFVPLILSHFDEKKHTES